MDTIENGLKLSESSQNVQRTGRRVIGFIGGTGPEGRGLSLRFALAGESVLLGSRDEAKAKAAADSISSDLSSDLVGWGDNNQVASVSDLVFVTVPYKAHMGVLEDLRTELLGKIVVDVVVPLAIVEGVAEPLIVRAGSAALEAQIVLPDSVIVSAFQTISAYDLLARAGHIQSDVVVCSDDDRARNAIMNLAEKIDGVRAVNGGGLDNARYMEDFASFLLNINRLHNARSSMRIVGI